MDAEMISRVAAQIRQECQMGHKGRNPFYYGDLHAISRILAAAALLALEELTRQETSRD